MAGTTISLPPSSDDPLELIATALYSQGWVVVPDFLSVDEAMPLLLRANNTDDFSRAGIGRGDEFQQNRRVRSDKICWIDDAHPIDQVWLNRMDELRLAINRRLFLGLFEFESHYAIYQPGDFYARHVDAFKGQSNRVVTTVFYLNPEWQPEDGGELVIYPPEHPEGVSVQPRMGTLVVFLSEDFPHEVLVSHSDRYSIAGWFRLNNTTADNLDLPR